MEWFSGGGRIETCLKHAGDEECHPCSMISERCACGCDSSGHTVSARREDRGHARDTSAQGQAGRRRIDDRAFDARAAWPSFFPGRRPWRARARESRARARWRLLLPLAHLRSPRRRRCLSTEEAAPDRHLTLVVRGHLGGDRSPICGDSDHVAAPARPPTHLGASKPPAAKPEDLPRGWARDSTRRV